MLPLAAQVLNVGVADVGDHRHIRGGNLGQIVDLRSDSSHLQHTDLVLGRQTEQGQGKTQLVVEVSLRFQNPELLLTTEATMSLVVVLPTLPVMPMTGMGNFSLYALATWPMASMVSSTWI